MNNSAMASPLGASKAGPASLISWIVGAIFFGVIAVAWMELGTMLPRRTAGYHARIGGGISHRTSAVACRSSRLLATRRLTTPPSGSPAMRSGSPANTGRRSR
jgi:hypothetical protein